MLTPNMTLNEIINFKPEDEDMMSLPLEAVVYIKVSIISLTKEDNYNFIRFLFTSEDIKDNFFNYESTIFYDFDGTKTKQEKFITCFEMYGSKRYSELSEYLVELINKYTHEADVIFDLYTHNNHEYRLSNLEGIVKLEELNVK